MRPCGDMMGSVTEVVSPPAVNPSALSGVRFLVSKRIEELEAAAADIEAELLRSVQRLDQLRTHVDEAEARWRTLLGDFAGGSIDEIDTAFRVLAAARADAAATEERRSELS